MQRRMSPREANRMMAKMGMQVQQVDDVTRVVIETPSKKIIIDEPEVAIVSVQGQKVYQVGGGRSREEGATPVTTSQDDAKLVASQAGVSVEVAASALLQSGGDLAQAIILLKQKKPA